jgi:hypothetical protein
MDIYCEWNSERFLSQGTSNSRGAAIIFNKNIDSKHIDNKGNFIVLDFTIEDKRITLINLYGPNTDQPFFYSELFDIIDRIGNDSYIVCGDLSLSYRS